MQNAAVNLEGLTDEQIRLVARFVEILRRAHGEGENATKGDLAQLWADWSAGAPALSTAEADALSDEAVRYARGLA